jgi:hypothetical protein
LKNSHTITTGSTDAVQFVQKKLKEHADAQVDAKLICDFPISYSFYQVGRLEMMWLGVIIIPFSVKIVQSSIFVGC